MPFMFEREGDYTELLIPANLLAADSILARAAAVLSEEVCRDVEVIGWLYQFYISERKDQVMARKSAVPAEDIPAVTQLFTPHWIVRYLVENSLGRLWMLNHPNSPLVGQMDYYIAPVDEETDFLQISSPEELTVIDPACGSGHMLTYAFDLWWRAFNELAPKYPTIKQDYAHVDATVMWFVKNPEWFDVIVTDNMFGDILSDGAGAIAGSLGMLPSASLGPVDRFGRRKALYEPVHGSAPDIAGQGIADPTATISSMALLLDHLGRGVDARRIVAAVDADVTARGSVRRSTTEVGDAIALELYPGGTGSGSKYYKGIANVDSVSRSGGTEGAVESSFGFSVNGALTATAVP